MLAWRSMKAAVNTRYGPPEVIQIREVPAPTPGTSDVLVRVHASTVSRTDCAWRRAHPFFVRLMSGLLRPKQTILGMDFAGVVEKVGAEVTSFELGDRVFGLTPGDHGGHAEYLRIAESDAIATIPGEIPFEQAVICEGSLYADTNLRAFDIRPGQTILIYGASGAIGTAALQLAKAYGAEVTAVVGTKNLELAESLGADRVIDYTAQDITRLDETFDFIFDAVGKVAYFKARHLLGPAGHYGATDMGPRGQNLPVIIWSALTRSKRFQFPIPRSTKAMVESWRELMEAGQLRAVVDREYPLDDIVQAHRYVEAGQKTGIVVVKLA